MHRLFENFSLQFDKPQCKMAAISWGKNASPTSPVKSRSRRSWRCERGSRGCVFKVHIKWKITLRWILWDVAYQDGALFREFRALIRVVSQYIVIWIKSYLVQKESPSPRLVRGNDKLCDVTLVTNLNGNCFSFAFHPRHREECQRERTRTSTYHIEMADTCDKSVCKTKYVLLAF